ncbi:hypothetical protein PHLH6_20450 [Pseudomonas sp. Seg1]|uniref:hypothetical protein n=1 Tax=Pseudomonas sp. Seg1 TaxID=2678259 RepID=UPI001BB306B9|nr:hypothetical protein [Pseudomonas sp. Seg1]BBP70041.1 hypothetical protein PHLH6_20450 [Pseudomonas sp. Seg1]
MYIPNAEEVHVGYDLGFALPLRNFNLNGDQFFEWMKDRISDTSSADSAFLMAYFYQYKVLDYVTRLSSTRNKSTKEGLVLKGYIASAPAYRIELYTERKLYANRTRRRPFSQHEALCRLTKVKGTNIYYCAPKFLLSNGIPHVSTRSVNDLNLVQVTNQTSTYRDKETHYIYFQTISGANAQWCSLPTPAFVSRERDLPPLLTPKQLLQLMKANYLAYSDVETIDFKEVRITDDDLSRETFLGYLSMMPECTRFVAFAD